MVISQWDQNNCPKRYIPYRVDDFVFIFGECSGIVIFPYGNHLGYTLLEDDDGFYYLTDRNINKSVYWMLNDIKYLWKQH